MRGSHHKVRGSHHKVRGSHHKVRGSHHKVRGSHHKVRGSHHKVRGSHHKVRGSHHKVRGSHHKVRGGGAGEWGLDGEVEEGDGRCTGTGKGTERAGQGSVRQGELLGPQCREEGVWRINDVTDGSTDEKQPLQGDTEASLNDQESFPCQSVCEAWLPCG